MAGITPMLYVCEHALINEIIYDLTVRGGPLGT